MKTDHIADQIIALKKDDLQLRSELLSKGELSGGYDTAMEELHNRNATILASIIDRIGFPTTGKVGEEAGEAAWMVVQHAIGQPAFMKRCRDLLEVAVNENEAEPMGLAYLTDRIAVLEGKVQFYGTQFDWDENGELSPNPYDDLDAVNQRRRSIGLNSLEEQTELIRTRMRKEKQSPPEDHEMRNREFADWKKKAGWTT